MNDPERDVIDAAVAETDAEAMVGEVSLLTCQVRRRNAVLALVQARKFKWTTDGGSVYGHGFRVQPLVEFEPGSTDAQQFSQRHRACHDLLAILNWLDPPEVAP